MYKNFTHPPALFMIPPPLRPIGQTDMIVAAVYLFLHSYKANGKLILGLRTILAKIDCFLSFVRPRALPMHCMIDGY